LPNLKKGIPCKHSKIEKKPVERRFLKSNGTLPSMNKREENGLLGISDIRSKIKCS
jgi:hypothetical protein